MKHVFPKSNVCVRVESVLSNRSQPKILKVLKKVLLSLINKRLKKKMSCRFNIMTTIARGINRVMEILLELLFSQLNQTKSKSCNKLNPFRIMTVINRSTSWSYELKNIFLKYRYAFTITKGRTYLPETMKYWVSVQRAQPYLI